MLSVIGLPLLWFVSVGVGLWLLWLVVSLVGSCSCCCSYGDGVCLRRLCFGVGVPVTSYNWQRQLRIVRH